MARLETPDEYGRILGRRREREYPPLITPEDIRRYILARYATPTHQEPVTTGRSWYESMSSTYRIICLSHDPAFILDFESQHREAVEQVSTTGDTLYRHENCDLVAGRFSYPLIEVGCFPRKGPNGHSACKVPQHSNMIWYDRDVLRLVWWANRISMRRSVHLVADEAHAITFGHPGVVNVPTGQGGGGGATSSPGSGGGAGGTGTGGGGGASGSGFFGSDPIIPPGILEPFLGRCWPFDRLDRLRFDLELEVPR